MTFSSASTPSTSSNQTKTNLVAVIGTTGVGKSQLAIDLALALPNLYPKLNSAEIINHDSMQVYKGSDIFTNKATTEEMMGVPHHLMGFLEPGEEYYVGDFKKDAIKKISELELENKLPIAVGGTTYYLQNLILPNNLVSDVPVLDRPPSPASNILRCSPSSESLALLPKTAADIASFPLPLQQTILSLPVELLELFFIHPLLPVTSTPDSFPPNFPISSLPLSFRTPEKFVLGVYDLLKLIDPDSAKRWHWRDVRKVRRSLEIVWMGQTWKDVVDAQKIKTLEGEGTRYRSLIFWLWSDSVILQDRLDSRVDKMVERGLLEEIEELWKVAGSSEITNYNQGIYQAIGFKEFEPYFANRPSDSTTIDKLDPNFKSGLERMKISTRQYAKSQIKWIQIKLLPAIRELEDKDDVTVILLDATDLSKWKELVLDPATQILKDFLNHNPLPDPTSLSAAAAVHLSPPVVKDTSPLSYVPCEICTYDSTKPFLVIESNWKEHIRSRSHRKSMNKDVKRGLYQGKGKERGNLDEKEREGGETGE